jgi:hypothetical protein
MVWLQVAGGADMKATAWGIVALAVGAWRYRAWQQKDTVRRFASTLQPVPLARRLQKTWPLLAFGFGVPLLITAVSYVTDEDMRGARTALVFVPAGVLGLLLIAFHRQEKVLTPGAAQLKATFDAEQARKNEHWADPFWAFLANRYIRYPLSGVLLYFAYETLQDPKSKGIYVAALLFWTLFAAWEVSAWLLGAGVVIGVLVLGFNLVAALPVSVAIIIGALIIAGAVKK